MTKEYSNEEFGFGSTAYAEPAPKREEDKIAKSSSAPAKIQKAAETAVAPPAQAASAFAPDAIPAALPALPTASAGAAPAIENPAQSADFWASALKGVGLPVGLGLAAGAAGNYIMGKLGPKASAPAGAAAPTVESNAPVEVPLSRLEELQIQQAEHKLQVDRDKAAREASAFEAEQRRADELHQKLLEEKNTRIAKQSAGKLQKAQGISLSDPDAVFGMKSTENSVSKAVDAEMKASVQKQKPPAPTPVVKPTAAPAVQTNPTTQPEAQWATPEEVAAQQAAKTSKSTTTKTQAAPAEVQGAKAPKWPGGPEGSAIQLFGGTKKNYTPESQASLEMFKDFVGKPLSMPPTGGSIHQIEDAGKFYEKYTGKSLPRSPEGKLVPIPEPQIKELHAGIKTELEDAIKGNKLGSLGKGAMAAAALLGLTGAVQAAQKGDFGPLREAGFDIGGPVALGKLGIAALSRAAGTGFSAATYAGNLNEGEGRELARRRHEYQMQESQKLGSPLRSVPPPR